MAAETNRADPRFVQNLKNQLSMWELNPTRSAGPTEVYARRYVTAVDHQIPVDHRRVVDWLEALTPKWQLRDDLLVLLITFVLAAGSGAALVTVGSSLFGDANRWVAVGVAALVAAVVPLLLRKVVLIVVQSRADSAAGSLDAELPQAVSPQ